MEAAPQHPIIEEVASRGDTSRESSSHASSQGQQFEGGQEEEKAAEAPPPKMMAPRSAPFRPPVRAPMFRPPQGMNPRPRAPPAFVPQRAPEPVQPLQEIV